jgi:hypothetical protein
LATELGLADRLMPLMSADDLAFRVNQSPGPVATEVSRRLRRSGVACNPVYARAVTARIEVLAAEHGLDAHAFQGLDAAMLSRASECFAAANDCFAQRVWGEPWSRRVAEPAPVAVNELAGQTLDPQLAGHVDSILTAVSSEFDLRLGASLREVGRDVRETLLKRVRWLTSAASSN